MNNNITTLFFRNLNSFFRNMKKIKEKATTNIFSKDIEGPKIIDKGIIENSIKKYFCDKSLLTAIVFFNFLKSFLIA